MENQIRQPIVTIAGHVDHGKTSLLDSIRKTLVQEGEAGGITQKISFTSFPKEQIIKRCPLMQANKINLEIPGFLFIDTPGHAAFSNLRKRGGALADLAVLVIDINEGIKPQTAEVIGILKMNKTPFVIALNKIDNISGWKRIEGSIIESINNQAINVKQDFQEKLMTLEGSLYSYGFEAAPYYEITDFSSKLVLVPCSAKTGEGINELIMTLCGLSQKYLKGRLKLVKEGKGVILEVKKEKSIDYVEAILYEGSIKTKQEIVIASFEEPIIAKIRMLEEVLPVSSKFKPVLEAKAATGIRMQLTENLEILPGMPFQVYSGDIESAKREFRKEVSEKIKTDEEGIIIKADSLGSLEALINLLRQEGIRICKAGIGNIDKKDIISANANLKKDKCSGIILGFNVGLEEDVKEIKEKETKIILNDVVYRLIEDLQEYRQEKAKEIEKQKLERLASICRLKILHEYVFHNSNPAIFGVRVEEGRLKANTRLMNADGKEIGEVKKVQSEGKGVDEALQKMEVAISLPGVNFDRQLKEEQELYSDLRASQFKEFKKNKELLSKDEIDVLQKIAQIKRKADNTWGV